MSHLVTLKVLVDAHLLQLAAMVGLGFLHIKLRTLLIRLHLDLRLQLLSLQVCRIRVCLLTLLGRRLLRLHHKLLLNLRVHRVEIALSIADACRSHHVGQGVADASQSNDAIGRAVTLPNLHLQAENLAVCCGLFLFTTSAEADIHAQVHAGVPYTRVNRLEHTV